MQKSKTQTETGIKQSKYKSKPKRECPLFILDFDLDLDFFYMARLSGVELNDRWKLDYALTRLKGIGWTLAEKVLADVKLDGSKRMSELSAEDLSKLTANLDGYTIEGDLIRLVRGNIARLQSISSYRGSRHAHSLPSRGQRTRRNARTKRGKRKTVGAFKKEALAAKASDKK